MNYVYVCKICNRAVPRGDLQKHMLEEHMPTDYFEIHLVDEWEKK